MSRPYRELYSKRYKVRAFDSKTLNEELMWHKDEKHRYVKIIKSNGWSIQFENSLPTKLIEDLSYFIEAEEWHRLIKGRGELVIEIGEL